MSEHTKGPWKTVTPKSIDKRDLRFGYLDVGIVDLENKIIGETYGMVDTNNTRPAEANARLMAAAPELLEALKKTLEWIRRPRPDGKMNILYRDDPHKPPIFMSQIIYEAIAKAEGNK